MFSEASEEQIENLSNFLGQRYQAATAGELYQIDDFSPSDVANVIFVDTGIMLIALDECMTDIENAVATLQKVMFLTFQTLGFDEQLPSSASEISVETQMQIHGVTSEEESWLLSMCLLATHFLYELDTEALSSDEQREIGRLSSANLNDVWACYATTMSILGHDTDPGAFSWEDDH